MNRLFDGKKFITSELPRWHYVFWFMRDEVTWFGFLRLNGKKIHEDEVLDMKILKILTSKFI